MNILEKSKACLSLLTTPIQHKCFYSNDTAPNTNANVNVNTTATPNPTPSTQPVPPVKERLITHKTVKTIFLEEKGVWTKISKVGVVALASCALWTYIYDWYDIPEQKLVVALESLSIEDKNKKMSGFDRLNNALFVSKRVFSGRVGVPIGVSMLKNADLFKTMVDITSSNDASLSLNAYVWLYKLVSTLKTSDLLLQADPGFEKLTSTLVQENYNKNYNWIMAANVLLRIKKMDYGDAVDKIDKKSLAKGIESMVKSGNPLAMATAFQLNFLTPGLELDEPTNQFILQNSSSQWLLDHSFIDIGLQSVPEYSVRQELCRTMDSKSSIPSIIGFSLFAAFWGKLRWFIKTRTSAEFHDLLKKDHEQALQARSTFMKKRAIGRSVFGLMLFDYVASNILQYTSGESLSFTDESPIQLPLELSQYDYPLSSVFPAVQTSLFAAGWLYLIRKQKYVVLPLVLAGVYNNSDLFRNPLVDHYQKRILDKSCEVWARYT